MRRVLICDKLEASGLDLLRQAGLEVDNRPGLKGDELRAALRAADGCIVRSGTHLAGKTLGVVGLGRIGREVARRAAGLDMQVIGYDPFLSSERAGQLGIESVADLNELLPRCDFLTVHTPLTDETRDLIGPEEI